MCQHDTKSESVDLTPDPTPTNTTVPATDAASSASREASTELSDISISMDNLVSDVISIVTTSTANTYSSDEEDDAASNTTTTTTTTNSTNSTLSYPGIVCASTGLRTFLWNEIKYGRNGGQDWSQYYIDNIDHVGTDRDTRTIGGMENLPPPVQEDLMYRRSCYSMVQEGNDVELDDATVDSDSNLNSNHPDPDEALFEIFPPFPCDYIHNLLQDSIYEGTFQPNSTTGSYLTLSLELGQAVDSKDTLIQAPHVNVYKDNYQLYNVIKGEYSHLTLQEMEERHEQMVRLIRYEELIELVMEENEGLEEEMGRMVVRKPCLYDYDGENDNDDRGEKNEKGRDANSPNSPNSPNSSDADAPYQEEADALTANEGLPLIEAFTFGLYDYCAGSEFMVGELAVREHEHAGEKTAKGGRVDSGTTISIRSLQTLLDQCDQLRHMYKREKKPLGKVNYTPRSIVQIHMNMDQTNSAKSTNSTTTTKTKNSKSRKKKGYGKKKKNKGPSQNPTHGTILENHITTLFETLATSIERPSLYYYHFLMHLIDMFHAAIDVDIDVAKALCVEAGPSVIQFQDKALQFAKNVDEVSLISSIYSKGWWSVYDRLYQLLTKCLAIVVARKVKKYSKALHFFEKTMIPRLMENVLSNSASEKYCGWNVLAHVSTVFPSGITLHFFENADIWQSIVSLCEQDVETYMKIHSSAMSERAKERESKFYAEAVKAALHFVMGVVKNGFEAKWDRFAPNEVAQKAIDQGVIELCMNVAKNPKSQHEMVYYAMEIVADLTVVEEVRDFLWKDKDGVMSIITKMMKSNYGDHVSMACFAACHLCMGVEWRSLVLSMKDPIIEKLCVKWVVFGMRSFCDRAYKVQSDYFTMRESLKQRVDKYKALKLKQIRSRKDVTLGEATFLSRFEMDHVQWKHATHWSEIEKEGGQWDDIQRVLARPMLLLSLLVATKDSPTRFKKVKCLSLAAASLDTLNGDLYASSITLIANFFGKQNIRRLHGRKVGRDTAQDADDDDLLEQQTGFDPPTPDDFEDPLHFVATLLKHKKRTQIAQLQMINIQTMAIVSEILVSGDPWLSLINSCGITRKMMDFLQNTDNIAKRDPWK